MREVRLVTKNKIALFAKLAFAICLCLSVVCFFTGKKAQTADAASYHECYLLGDCYGIGQEDVDALVTYIDMPELIGLTPSEEPYCYYLTEDVSWSEVLVAPDGVFMVICLNGHTADGVIDNESTTGGVYLIQCGSHNCLEMEEEVAVVDQAFFDAMRKFYQGYDFVDVYMYVALRADVVLDESWVLSPDSCLEICLNGNEIIGGENLTALGGELIIHDCSLLHDCYYFGTDAMRVTQEMVDGMLFADRTNEAWGMYPSDEPYFVYITEDLYWDGVLSAPDGVYIALCLNGHELKGAIDNSVTQNGGIFPMQCGVHTCAITLETTLAISDGYIRLLETMCANQGGKIDLGGASIAINTDVTFTNPSVWEMTAGESAMICSCGHTITNLEYVTAKGGVVNVVDCSTIGDHACEELDGRTAEYLTQSALDYLVDSNGVLKGEGVQTLCLLGNVKLNKTLVIPTGMDVTLCLNGFALTSPKIVWGQQDLKGEVIVNECCTAIQVQPGAKLTICDCSHGETGRVTVNFVDGMTGMGSLGASSVLNCGELVIKGGNLVGVMSVLNCGDLLVEGGSIVGLLVGVAQGEEVAEDFSVIVSDPTFEMNGGEIHSAAVGVVAENGDLVLNDGVIVAQAAGMASSFDIERPTGDCVIYLNGGEITVGKIEYSAYRAAGLPIEDGEDTGISSSVCIGIACNTTLFLGGDAVINMEGDIIDNVDYAASIMMGNDSSIEIVDGAKVEAVYEVSVKGDGHLAYVSEELFANIVPSKGSILTISEDEGYQVAKNDGSINCSASVYGASISLEGSIVVNFYVAAEEEFVNNPDARVIFLYKGQTYYYTIDQATRDGSYYVFEIEVSAKDYQKNITCNFTDGKNVWYGNSTTINRYLNYLINRQTYAVRGVDAAKEIARRVQNYCMTASYYFDISTEYTPEEDVTAEMAQVTLETVEPYRASMIGSSSKVTFAGASLLLQSNTTIRVYFYLKFGYTIEDVSLFVDGVAVEAIMSEDGNSYYVEINNISAQNLGKMFTIQIDGYQIKYCGLSYAYSVLAYQSTDVELVNMVKSMYVYHKFAYEYFN